MTLIYLESIARDLWNYYPKIQFIHKRNVKNKFYFAGSCHYNVTGKNYKTGDTWTQGCAENCICLDGNSGKYECKPV